MIDEAFYQCPLSSRCKEKHCSHKAPHTLNSRDCTSEVCWNWILIQKKEKEPAACLNIKLFEADASEEL